MKFLPPGFAPGSRWRGVLLGGVFLGAAALVLHTQLFHNGLPIVRPGDDVRLMYEALLNSRGSLIYRDFFEFAQPGIVFFLQGWGALAGFGIMQLNYAVLTIWLAVTFAVWRIGSAVVPSPWAAVCAACTLWWCAGIMPIYHVSAAALLMGAAAVLEPPRPMTLSSQVSRRALLAGFLAGLAFVTMQSRGAMGGLALLAWTWRRRGAPAAMLFAIAAAVPVVAVGSYFALNGGLADWLHFTLVFAVAQAPRGTWAGLHVFAESFRTDGIEQVMRSAVLYAPAVLAPFVATAALMVRDTPALVRLLGLLVLSQVAAVLWGPEVYRLLAGVFPAFIIAAWFCSRLRTRAVWLSAAALVMTLLLGNQMRHVQAAPYVTIPDRVANSVALLVRSDESPRYEWVLRHTTAGETVAFYPWENDLLFLGDLRNPGKYLWLDEGGFNSDTEIASALDAWRTRPPRLAMWLKVVRNDGSEVSPQRLRPLKAYLDRCYDPVASFAYGDLFEYRHGQDGCGDDSPR